MVQTDNDNDLFRESTKTFKTLSKSTIILRCCSSLKVAFLSSKLNFFINPLYIIGISPKHINRSNSRFPCHLVFFILPFSQLWSNNLGECVLPMISTCSLRSVIYGSGDGGRCFQVIHALTIHPLLQEE